MRSHEALKLAVDGKGPKVVAAELGVSLSLVYKWTQDPLESGTKNPLDRVVELLDATGHDAPLRFLCERADGVFVKNPDTDAPPAFDVLKETQRVLREFSDVLDAIARAFADDRVTADEARLIRREWEELKACGEAVVRASEARVEARAPKKAR